MVFIKKKIELLALQDGTIEPMYEIATRLLEKLHWMPFKQVALATDGASNMTGHRMGLLARMRA